MKKLMRYQLNQNRSNDISKLKNINILIKMILKSTNIISKLNSINKCISKVLLHISLYLWLYDFNQIP